MAIVNYSDDLANDFSIIAKNSDNIIAETFSNEKERLLAKSIIENLESDAVDGIKQGLTVKIPRVGNYRYNPLRKHLINHYKDFKSAKKSMNKEEYKEYVGTTVDNWKEEERLKELNKIKVKKMKARYKKKYEYLIRKRGFNYANLWFKFLLEVKPVEFDAELEAHLQRLYGYESS